MIGESPSYFDSGNKIAEIQGCFIMALEFFNRIHNKLKYNYDDAKFFYKMIKRQLESAELILKINESDIPHDEYVTLKKTLERQWKLYHDWQIKFDSKTGTE